MSASSKAIEKFREVYSGRVAVRRGEYTGKRQGGSPADEAEHFYKCAECGGWVDMRDLGSVFDHEPGGPHPATDKPQ